MTLPILQLSPVELHTKIFPDLHQRPDPEVVQRFNALRGVSRICESRATEEERCFPISRIGNRQMLLNLPFQMDDKAKSDIFGIWYSIAVSTACREEWVGILLLLLLVLGSKYDSQAYVVGGV